MGRGLVTFREQRSHSAWLLLRVYQMIISVFYFLDTVTFQLLFTHFTSTSRLLDVC